MKGRDGEKERVMKEKGRERKGKEGERGTESLLRLSLSILCLSY